jgi:hypothetical protein
MKPSAVSFRVWDWRGCAGRRFVDEAEDAHSVDEDDRAAERAAPSVFSQRVMSLTWSAVAVGEADDPSGEPSSELTRAALTPSPQPSWIVTLYPGRLLPLTARRTGSDA